MVVNLFLYSNGENTMPIFNLAEIRFNPRLSTDRLDGLFHGDEHPEETSYYICSEGHLALLREREKESNHQWK